MPTAFCPTCVKLSDTKSVGFRSRSTCCLSSSPRHRGALSGGCGASRLPLCAAPVSTYCGGTRCGVFLVVVTGEHLPTVDLPVVVHDVLLRGCRRSRRPRRKTRQAP